MAIKEYLLTPGPTWIPQRIFEAMARGTVHHRTDVFKRSFGEALEGVQWLFGATETPLLLACSGTGAMEAVLRNVTRGGESVVYVNAGIFGERWGKIASRLGLNGVPVHAPTAGESISAAALEETLHRTPECRALCLQVVETSTAVLHPVAELAAIARRVCPQALIIVDAISAAATLPCTLQALNADIVIGASQKAVMLPPGLAFVALAPRAWQSVEQGDARSLYFDFKIERKAHLERTSAWTPALHLILGFNEAVRILREEGLENTFARHERLSRLARTGLEALELRLLAPSCPAPGVTGAYPPDGVDADALRSSMVKKFGVRIAGGQGGLTGKIIRIGHMGYISEIDLLGAIAALEICLREAGAAARVGAGTAAVVEQMGR